jgi:hypothetical protein
MERDVLDIWQYIIFKWVLFLFFIVTILKLVNTELRVAERLRAAGGKIALVGKKLFEMIPRWTTKL